jgi:hypothetical protein
MWGFISVDVNQQACALTITVEDFQRGKTRSKCCSRLTGRMILVVGNENVSQLPPQYARIQLQGQGRLEQGSPQPCHPISTGSD